MKQVSKKLRGRTTARTIATSAVFAHVGGVKKAHITRAGRSRLYKTAMQRRSLRELAVARSTTQRIYEIISRPISDAQREKAQLLVDRAREAQHSAVTNRFRREDAA